MYRLTVDGVETYMVVTRNVFSHRLTVHRKYDLKVGPRGCAVAD
jgi:1-phosphatidylinositol-5-phosphate 4-kinase